MAGNGNPRFIVEFGDLENENAVCQVVSDFPEQSYAGVGTFINGKALICGGWNNLDSSWFNRCYSWNSEVNLPLI